MKLTEEELVDRIVTRITKEDYDEARDGRLNLATTPLRKVYGVSNREIITMYATEEEFKLLS